MSRSTKRPRSDPSEETSADWTRTHWSATIARAVAAAWRPHSLRGRNTIEGEVPDLTNCIGRVHNLLADQPAADRLHKLVRLTLWTMLAMVAVVAVVAVVRPAVIVALFS